MDLGLKGKVLMVSAASKGLGLGIARQAAQEGAILSIGSRSSKNIKDAAESIQKLVPGAKVFHSILDVSNTESIEAVLTIISPDSHSSFTITLLLSRSNFSTNVS